MKKYTLILTVLFLLSFPLSALAFTLDASSVPDNQGDNNLYAYAYIFSAGTYRLLDEAGTQYETFEFSKI